MRAQVTSRADDLHVAKIVLGSKPEVSYTKSSRKLLDGISLISEGK